MLSAALASKEGWLPYLILSVGVALHEPQIISQFLVHSSGKNLTRILQLLRSHLLNFM